MNREPSDLVLALAAVCIAAVLYPLLWFAMAIF
jgi:hypothetical protein